MNKTINVFELPSEATKNKHLIDGSCTVVIDVLRSTTTLTYAVNAGLLAIIPVLQIEDALQFQTASQADRTKDIILGGERGCERINQFDVGNSPLDMIPEIVKNKTMIFTSTNGTHAMLAAKTAAKLLLAGFVNIGAVVKELKNENHIVIICSGTEGKITSEDILLAGAIVSLLKLENDTIILDKTAADCMNKWNDNSQQRNLLDNLRISDGAKKLIQLGFDKDIEAAAKYNSINIVPKIDFNKIDYTILNNSADY
ncbi:MAG: 2-phosphosulfolactate phosphatase [Planctomycetaceae bacterium]|jgi:2-phosphosulfolactate phosphatase|nr:2-phosphosulfolactate phosphatase [Planctomycetaceae bacterium]